MRSSLKKVMIWQYIVSLCLGCLVLGLLYSTPEGRLSLTLSDEQSIDHPWNGSDTMSYVGPARYFLETFTFEKNGQPDMHRTIGYPFFLSILMLLFGKYWVAATYLLQLAVSMSLFPAVTYMMDSFFPSIRNRYHLIVFALLILGVTLAYVGLLLTDQFFTSLLYVGLAIGFYAIRNASWKAAFLHILVIGYAAQVRPTLGLFFISECFLFLYIAKLWLPELSKNVVGLVIVMVTAIAIVGNGPAIRNYYNHGLFTPTDILADNLARYLAGPVMIAEGLSNEYNSELLELKQLEGMEMIVIQKEFAFAVYRQFPFSTVSRMVYHAFWNCFEPHWEYILNVYHKGFYLNSFYDNQGKLEKMIFLNIPFIIFYSSLYSYFFYSILRRKGTGKILLFVGVVTFLLPFFASFINGQGARMRLFAEPMIMLLSCGFFQMQKNKRRCCP